MAIKARMDSRCTFIIERSGAYDRVDADDF
jgi:hypothetical protein